MRGDSVAVVIIYNERQKKSAVELGWSILQWLDHFNGTWSGLIHSEDQYYYTSYKNHRADNRHPTHSHPQFFFLMNHLRKEKFAKRVEHGVFSCDVCTLGALTMGCKLDASLMRDNVWPLSEQPDDLDQVL